METSAFFPKAARASVTPISVVDLPSPAGVGETPVTKISLPSGRDQSILLSSILALLCP